ncbi:MAG: prephenate dehydratase, partial [Chloroflexi bacterium]|nr:prephenate dehydratase [Chloroflexota bacterium]
MRLAHLGPSGTFTEAAAALYAPDAELVPYPSITSSARSILNGECDQAVTPIENSLQGAITETLDLLIHEKGFAIKSEVNLSVIHNLMASPGVSLGDIKRVYSHPQALGQCRGWLESHLPGVEVAAALSTAGSVEQAAKDALPAAAIAPRRAAALYGAHILVEGIQDDDNNVTRFLVLAPQDAEPSGDDKTSICFSFDGDQPGLLYYVMGLFTDAKINLTKVESRPTRLGLGRYYFLVDLEGHREDAEVKA